jgi:preprotein translocase subunit Sec61beta
MLNEAKVDPDRIVFFGCMFGALVVVVLNFIH